MRIVILGDGKWATDTLWRLRAAGHDIVAVLLRARAREAGLEEAARALRLPILQPRQVNAPECVASLRALAPDVLLSIAYDQILGADVRAAAPWCLNVHAGQLPRYRGRNVINWALINGEPEIGVTVHLVDAGIDTGDILLQRMLPVAWTDTYGDLLDRIVDVIPEMVTDSLALIAEGRATPRPQGEGGTYFGGRREGDEWIDWGHPSVEIYNKIRAIAHPGPGARTWLPHSATAAPAATYESMAGGQASDQSMVGEAMRHAGESVVIWRAVYERHWPRYLATPGEVVGRVPAGAAPSASAMPTSQRRTGEQMPAGIIVKTGDSTILLTDVQSAGRPHEAPRWPIGTRLGVDAATIAQTLLARRATLLAPS
jgi:methionyl-tRNA formyltransferase